MSSPGTTWSRCSPSALRKPDLNRGIFHRLDPWLFGLTIFLSAFLLFQIQPMIGKFILPWFGGGPSVWTASMMFFQVLLLGGYTYAHAISARPPRRQVQVHLLVLLAVFAWLGLMALTRQTPITPDPRLRPVGGVFPVWQVLAVLGVSVGVPYLLLSTTSSLAQEWYRQVRCESSPYAFYALSNAASFLALLSYPFLFEPNWTIVEQASFWSLGFLLYLGLMVLCAVRLARAGQAPVLPAAELPQPAEDPEAVRPGWKAALLWMGLAACSSVMLLASTNRITQDVASAPFMWVLPLSLYLLSFVLVFNERAVRYRWLFVLLTPAALYMGYWNLDIGSQMRLREQIATNAVMLLIICLLCHTELYARRPHPRYLTSFYLMVSLGGALGGVFVNLVAPLIFSDYWEYHLGLVFSGAAAALIAINSQELWAYRLRLPVTLAVMALVGLILYTPVSWVSGSVLMTRNFYGVLRIRHTSIDEQPGYNLVHGGILHGSQIATEPYRYRPTKYYTPSSGIGLAIQSHPVYIEGEPLRVGVVGLGVGTLAAYGRPSDMIRFYEIDPAVVEIASDERFFTYLDDSKAAVEVVLGDARLSMERELEEGRPQGYHILAVDAFSGDSIPTHLINREAMAIFLEHMDPQGIIAFHTSNRHLDLLPILALLEDEYDLRSAVISGGSGDWFGSSSTWVLLSRDDRIMNQPVIRIESGLLSTRPGVRVWTDDYSNLFQVMRDFMR